MVGKVITILLIICVFISIILEEISSERETKNWHVLLATFILGIMSAVSRLTDSSSMSQFLVGLYIMSVIGYTVFQWQQRLESDNTDCGYLVPRSNLFHKSSYYLYRMIYLTTMIVIISLLQAKTGGGLDSDGPFSLHVLLVAMPFILPLFTELFDAVGNLFSDKESNPESLLANFIYGQKEWPESDSGLFRLIFPIGFYVLLMVLAIDSSHGIPLPFTGSLFPGKGNGSIYIIIGFITCFSLIMRSIFIQDCSLEEDKNISEPGSEELPCSFEKYGGIQTMICTALIILLIYHVKNPIYKILTFIIICLGAWGLSTTYMLTLP